MPQLVLVRGLSSRRRTLKTLKASSRRLVLSCAFASFLFHTGCDSEPLSDGLPSGIACDTCHGNAGNPAPPLPVSGESLVTNIGVGAHRIHLRDGKLRDAMECSECHVVPADVDSPGHVDPLPAEITWGDLAANGGLEPVWDREQATCASTWCHGGALSGGLLSEPVWTLVDGTQTTCGSCHGYPPPSPHPASSDCHACHAQTVLPDGKINLAGGNHINGVKDVPAGLCTACHGGPDGPAPPVALNGSSETTDIGVGAHQAHLVDGSLRRAVGCGECHTVPTTVDAPGHIDSLPADLVWGPLASAGSLDPEWDREQATCTSTWCHGGRLTGGTLTEPVWTQVDGSQKACGTCHGVPPPGPHPQSGECNQCHPGTVTGTGEIDLDGGHLNGEVDVVELACNTCHGNEENAAPPVDTLGNSDTSFRGVGVHQAHLQDSDWHATIACDECHLVPSSLSEAGHVDSALPAELTWGALARSDGAQPSFDADNTTCSGVYCHGSTLKGTGLNRSPDWTPAGSGTVACGSCHSIPPDAGHPTRSDCVACHECVVDENQVLRPENSHLHVNGTVNFEPLGSCPTQ
jgi:predicted CxxxxCH...CXXCH cytochrome family protein